MVALSGSVNASIGDDLLLPSFAAPIIGGVALAGGVVAVLGTCLAAFIIRLVDVAQAQYSHQPLAGSTSSSARWSSAAVLDRHQFRPTLWRRSPAMTFTAEKIVKVFPGVRALDEADLRLEPGSIHALLGENGAGKSTLIKVLTGVYRPDGGRLSRIEDDGARTEITFARPLDAQRAGIGVVHQERNLVPAFSVAENIVLQAGPRRRGFVDRRAMRDLAARCLALLDVQLELDRPVGELSVAQTQLVEIAKALAVDSTGAAARRAHGLADRRRGRAPLHGRAPLRDQGHSIVLVSHKLEEVFAVADTVTVLRDGRTVAEAEPLADHTRDDVVTMMVGRAHADLHLDTRAVDRRAVPALELDEVSTDQGHEGISLGCVPAR